MKSVLAALVVATAGFVAGPAQADNSLYLTADYVSTNAAQLSVTGDYNVARVAQSFDGLGGETGCSSPSWVTSTTRSWRVLLEGRYLPPVWSPAS